MTTLNGYLTRAELQAAVSDSTIVHDAEYDRAIGAASRQIDLWTGRYFYQDTVASARLFRAFDRTTVCASEKGGPVDFGSGVGVTVATDDDADGVFETAWTDSQWQPEPFNPVNGWPYTRVTTTARTREFPLDARVPRVQVTALWGWATVPYPVAQACLALSTLYFRSKDMAGVAIGMDTNIEIISADPIKIAMKLVEPYAVEGGALFVPVT